MARKSRKVLSNSNSVELITEVKRGMATAAYARLSSEGARGMSDDTLETQVMLVHQFIQQNSELDLVDTYVDNGFTGTNFERPEFKRLIEDAKSGKIQCIVVKDLSRFGRDYLEAGYYIESIFPKLNIRMIAITDDFDSSRNSDLENIAIPLKNMVNNFYAKDISKKISSANDMKRKRGDFMGLPPFGYRLSENKKSFVIDEEVASYVRMVFQWAALGINHHEIARRLNLLNVDTPKQRKDLKKHGRKSDENARWRKTAIHKILRNPAYVGDTATGKTQIAYYKGQPFTEIEPENWHITPNTHAPLVARDDFEHIQTLLKKNSDDRKYYREQGEADKERLKESFPGLVFCGECGSIMRLRRFSHDYVTKEKDFILYSCSSSTFEKSCARNSIHSNLLKILVMDQIHLLITGMVNRKSLIRKINEPNSSSGSLASARNRINSLTMKIQKTEDKKTTLYEDYVAGLLNIEEYQFTKEHFIVELQKLRCELKDAQLKMRKAEKSIHKYLDLIKNLEKYLNVREFDETLVYYLVEKILIGTEGKVEISFKCKDVYEDIIKIVEGE